MVRRSAQPIDYRRRFRSHAHGHSPPRSKKIRLSRAASYFQPDPCAKFLPCLFYKSGAPFKLKTRRRRKFPYAEHRAAENLRGLGDRDKNGGESPSQLE